MNVSCHIHAWVMPRIWMSLVTRMNPNGPSGSIPRKATSMSHVTCMRISHVTHMNVWWFMAHIWMYGESWYMYECMSHGTYMNVWWIMVHIWMFHGTCVNESCYIMNRSRHIWESTMSHKRMSHVNHLNESCHTYEWVMSHMWISHNSVMSKTWLSHATHMESRHT